MNLNPRQSWLSLVLHEVWEGLVAQRISDGYINATAMCKSAWKLFSDYYRLNSTQNFLSELSADMWIDIPEIVQVIRWWNPEEQGTWIHPDIAINLWQWLSPKFAVAVSRWVREWVSWTLPIKQIPYHLQRYLANMSWIPHTHFSMLNELTFNLIAPLEQFWYSLPDNMVPDISEWRMFSDWIRKVKWLDPSEFPTYQHRYADWRVVSARLYPNSLLADFRKHFHEVWLPNKAMAYFQARDPSVLKYMPQFSALIQQRSKALPSWGE